MIRPRNVLVIQEASTDAANFATALRSSGAIQADFVGNLDTGILKARDGSYSVVFLSIILADPRKGSLAEIRRCFAAPVVFLVPGVPAPGSLPLESWEWLAAPFQILELQRTISFAVRLNAAETKVSSLQQRIRAEESLADRGRIATKGLRDIESALNEVEVAAESLRESWVGESGESFSKLESATTRARRLCQQLLGDAEPRPSAGVRPVQLTRTSGTILVVDDEESIRELAACVVQQMGANVVTARDGEEALLRFQADPNRFTAALLDLSLPRLTGIEVLSGIRSLRQNLPVILISGHGDESLASDPRLALNGMLRKPFSTDALRVALSRALKQTEYAAANAR